MPVDLSSPRILIELNGADPVNTYSKQHIVVDVLDYEEIGEMDVQDLIHIHDTYEKVAPRTARSIRDHLRERGVTIPAEYNSDFDKE